MTARCDTCDILLYVNTECELIYPCEKCQQYINCQVGVKMYNFSNCAIEDGMLYTDGETP